MKRKQKKASKTERFHEQDWEAYHIEKDQEAVKRIKWCNIKSTIYMLAGLACLTVGASSVLRRILLNLSAAAKASPTRELTPETAMTDVNLLLFAALIVLVLFCIFFFFKAMLRWDEAENISKSRFVWAPDEDEVAFIDKRFDNAFTRYMLRAISPSETRTIEVGFREITITSSYGKASCNYNKNGYAQLTNYGTKQLAYYLASHSFPDGFLIYQTKIVPFGSDRFLGGVSDIGGTGSAKTPALKRFSRMLLWLAVWLQDFLRLKTNFTLEEEETSLSPINNGQIVINKGYVSKSEDLKPL